MTTSPANILETRGPLLAGLLMTVAVLFFAAAVGLGAWWFILQGDSVAKRAQLKKAIQAASMPPQTQPAPADTLEKALESYPLPSAENLKDDITSSAQKEGLFVDECTTEEVSARPVVADMMQSHLRLVHLKLAGDLPNVLRWVHQSVENEPFRWITLFHADASGDETVYRMDILASVK